jgi:adenylosuccinate lyase
MDWCLSRTDARESEATKGLIFSGQLLLALTNKGVSRETAYDWCSEMRCEFGMRIAISDTHQG